MLVIKHAVRSANSCLSSRIISNQVVLVNHYSNLNKIGPRVAVILSGSGVYDGSEIHEASAILVHLSRVNARTQIYAPDIPQLHVVNHVKCEPALSEKRNVLVESARIARGHIQPLSTLSSDNHDGLVLPGGFGVAKNLSTFVVDGPSCKVISDVEKVIKQFHFSQKPMAMCCIAPVLAARIIKGCELTVGYDQEDDGKWPYASTVEAVEQMGSKHTNCNVNEIIVDEKNLLVSTPAFMCGTAPLHEIHDGIGRMIEAFLKLIQKKA